MTMVASISYFKRFKMELDLRELPAPLLPAGFSLLPWSTGLLDLHAEVLYQSFHQEIDAIVFPSLGERASCSCLMTEISRKRGFLPEATWLLIGPSGPCGSIQGIRERT